MPNCEANLYSQTYLIIYQYTMTHKLDSKLMAT